VSDDPVVDPDEARGAAEEVREREIRNTRRRHAYIASQIGTGNVGLIEKVFKLVINEVQRALQAAADSLGSRIEQAKLVERDRIRA